MRCFIEIDVPESIKAYLIEKITHIKNTSKGYDFRITKKENIHVTLAFLGEVNENALEDVIKNTSEIARKFDCIECSLSKIEAVPAKFPRMIWISLNNNQELSKLYEGLKKALMFENEHGRFKAHITIARIKPHGNANNTNTVLNIGKNDINHLKFRVSELKLMKSTLKSEGPEYDVIKSIPLDNLREPA